MSCSRFLISFSEKQCRVHGFWLVFLKNNVVFTVSDYLKKKVSNSSELSLYIYKEEEGVSKLIQCGLKAQLSPQPRATPWVNGYKPNNAPCKGNCKKTMER